MFGAWLAMDRACTPSCCLVCSAVSWALSVAMLASIRDIPYGAAELRVVIENRYVVPLLGHLPGTHEPAGAAADDGHLDARLRGLNRLLLLEEGGVRVREEALEQPSLDGAALRFVVAFPLADAADVTADGEKRVPLVEAVSDLQHAFTRLFQVLGKQGD